ncbi:MAG: hypothetical protein IJ776_07840 [Paludibacteraceae bacterium]|nr:hypothetical protein [Paludibacteraceae bacterium]
MKTGAKVATVLSIVTVLVLAGWLWFRFYFVFAEGVKAGELNRFTYKGYIFKTYEGKLIQAGYNSENAKGTIQSNEFDFSVDNEQVAEQLMKSTGKTVELHYKEYKGALPWRGMQVFVVDSIISVSQKESPLNVPIF